MLRVDRGAASARARARRARRSLWLDTATRHRPATGAPLGRAPLPGVRALPAPRRPSQNVRFGGREQVRRAARALPDLASRRRAHPAPSRAANVNASRLARALARDPTSSSSTSRSRHWTPTRATSSAASSTELLASSAPDAARHARLRGRRGARPHVSVDRRRHSSSRPGRAAELARRSGRRLRRELHRSEPASRDRRRRAGGSHRGPSRQWRLTAWSTRAGVGDGFTSRSIRGRSRSRREQPRTARSTNHRRGSERVTVASAADRTCRGDPASRRARRRHETRVARRQWPTAAGSARTPRVLEAKATR